MPSYLFVLCPPYSGSTLLWKLLSTSQNVSSLPDEGQFLPELEGIMRDKPWDGSRPLPWPKIKAVGESYRRHMGKWYPAMALVQVADLLEEGALVEIEATAVIPLP